MSEQALVLPHPIEKRERAITAPALTMPELLRDAIARGDRESAKDIMAMIREERADQARMAFTAAMARFKLNPPEIVKSKQVRFTTSKGVTEYKHATIGDVCREIIKGLSAVGISHRWTTEQAEGRIRVTCVLEHEQGHKESAALYSPPDESGGKNSIQAIASAVTYLERYTLLAVTGIATHDEDDDGSGAANTEKPSVQLPEGFATWQADMEAVADEGTERLQAAWQSSPANFRALSTLSGDWLPKLKAKAKAKVLR